LEAMDFFCSYLVKCNSTVVVIGPQDIAVFKMTIKIRRNCKIIQATRCRGGIIFIWAYETSDNIAASCRTSIAEGFCSTVHQLCRLLHKSHQANMIQRPGFDPTELVVIRSLTFFRAFADESTNDCTTIPAMTSQTGPKSS
jgi:hypothetical protein